MTIIHENHKNHKKSKTINEINAINLRIYKDIITNNQNKTLNINSNLKKIINDNEHLWK